MKKYQNWPLTFFTLDFRNILNGFIDPPLVVLANKAVELFYFDHTSQWTAHCGTQTHTHIFKHNAILNVINRACSLELITHQW